MIRLLMADNAFVGSFNTFTCKKACDSKGEVMLSVKFEDVL
jgi:hypothetical protein